MRRKRKDVKREEAIDRLRGWVNPGKIIYFIMDDVGKSGTKQKFQAYLIEPDPRGPGYTHDIVDASWNLAKATGLKFSEKKNREGAVTVGSGFNPAARAVYLLGRVLYPAGFGCIGDACHSEDHANGDDDYTPHYDGTPRNSSEVGMDLKPYRHYHNDGGGALSWRIIRWGKI